MDMSASSHDISTRNATLSIVIPACNEAGEITETVHQLVQAAAGRFRACEVIIIDDGSTDGTAQISENLARSNPSVKVLHNGVNRGMGYSYQRGLAAATGDYVVWATGDNSLPAASFQAAFDHLGEADMVVTYQASMAHRPILRRIISAAYTAAMRGISGRRLHYFNGPHILKREHALAVLPLHSQGFSAISEMVARLLAAGRTYVEVPVVNLPRRRGRTKAFRLRNVLSVIVSLMVLLWDIRIMPWLRRRR